MPFFPAAEVCTLASGLTVALERRPGPLYALDLRIPVGSAHDPVGLEGSTALLEEWLFKGAGPRDARQLQAAFDDLGGPWGGGVGLESTRLSVSGLIGELPAALGLLGDVLVRPHLPLHELPILLDLARQELDSLEDSPTDLLGVGVRRALLPRADGDPGAGFGHPVGGTPGGLAQITAATLHDHRERLGTVGSFLGVVGDLSLGDLVALVEAALAGWGPGLDQPCPTHFRAGVREHLPFETGEQTHFNLLAPGFTPTDPEWLPWLTAISALSGGSASRLFREVRERRGLAYDVSASSWLVGDAGFLSVYAGSTPERAAETQAVIGAELERWSRGVSEAEFERAAHALSSGAVFGAESPRSRARELTADLTVYGRVWSVAELRRAVGALSAEQVNAFLEGYAPLAQASALTLGPSGPEAEHVTSTQPVPNHLAPGEVAQ